MNKRELVTEIRKQFADGQWLYTKHAVDRAIHRNIWSYEMEEGIINSEVIEDYPQDKYGPSCLLLGWTKAHRPLHIQVTHPHPERKIKVITVYEPSLKVWEIGFKVRRSQA